MLVLKTRINSGAEKVVCHMIRAFADIQMVYCSP